MTKKRDQGSRKTIKSVHHALDMLEFLRDNGKATVTEVANGIGVAPSTAHHHLSTLAERQYVEKEGDRYRIGVRFFTFGGEAREQYQVYRIGHQTIDHLAEQTGETARLVVERNGYGITIYQSTGDQVGKPRTYLGMQETLHSTAVGKAFLAHLSDERVKNIIDKRGLPQQTERTITNREELFEELDRVRSRGIAYDIREHFDDLYCVAGPILKDGEVLGAVSVSVSTDRRDEEWLRNEAAPEVQNATGVIKVNNTYSSWLELPEE